METSQTASPCSPVKRRVAYGVLGVYWLILFVATHIPRLPPPPEMLQSDKLHHFLAYGLLTVLVMIAKATTRPLRATDYLSVFLILGIYGVFDELSQIPVGRSCELLDWVADLAGIVVGLAGIAVIGRVWQFRKKLRADRSSI